MPGGRGSGERGETSETVVAAAVMGMVATELVVTGVGAAVTEVRRVGIPLCFLRSKALRRTTRERVSRESDLKATPRGRISYSE